MRVVGTTPTHATSSARAGQRTDTSAAATPATVAIGTSGAARKFARIPTTLTEPCSTTTSGAVMACAATGMARAGPKGARRAGSRVADRRHPTAG